MDNVIQFPGVKRETPRSIFENDRYQPPQQSPNNPPKPKRKRRCVSGLQYYSRSSEWRASNVWLTEKPLLAKSYNWWIFLQVIKGKIVFNNYSYSSSTSKHQRKVRGWLDANGIKIDLFIQAPRGLQCLEDSIPFYERAIEAIQSQIDKPRSRKEVNFERANVIKGHRLTIKEIKKLIKGRK